jgi:hypothetical protein
MKIAHFRRVCGKRAAGGRGEVVEAEISMLTETA